MNAQEAVRTGWRALRGVFRLWSIEEREDLTVWLRGHGFAGTRPGNHIAARAQEFILSEACRVDARVALLEVTYVAAVLHIGRMTGGPRGDTPRAIIQRPCCPAARGSRNGSVPASSWQELDAVNVEDVFFRRVPMLRSCPRFLRGRFRECFSLGLRERFRAKQEGDVTAEIRGWKLFLLVPMMILHKTSGTSTIGRNELAARVDAFARGRWRELLEEALRHTQPSSSHTLTEEEEKGPGGVIRETQEPSGRPPVGSDEEVSNTESEGVPPR